MHLCAFQFCNSFQLVNCSLLDILYLQINISNLMWRSWILCSTFIFYCVSDTLDRNLTMGISRHIRSLHFPQSSGMGIFFALSIPIDIPDKSISFSYYFEANYGMPSIKSANSSQNSCCDKRSIDRRLFYDIIQNKFDSYGYPGRECLLLAICESAKFPFEHSGLLGDIIRILFTPSSTVKEHLHPEIERAQYVSNCSIFSQLCPLNLLETISI